MLTPYLWATLTVAICIQYSILGTECQPSSEVKLTTGQEHKNTLKIGHEMVLLTYVNKQSFSVKTPVFEGPLDLLLELISKRKLFVSDVSLAQVTDDFIRYIETHEDFPLGESAEFIVVASTLMLVKSRSLLPGLMLTEEEEEDIHDLEHRLVLHAYFKELSAELGQMYGKQIIFEKSASRNRPILFAPDGKTSTENLSLALQALVDSLPKKESLPKAAVRKMVSLEETILSLSERIEQSMKMNFKDLYGTGELTPERRVSIIVSFLAMLELVKRGIIRATQGVGGEIEMEREGSTSQNLSSEKSSDTPMGHGQTFRQKDSA